MNGLGSGFLISIAGIGVPWLLNGMPTDPQTVTQYGILAAVLYGLFWISYKFVLPMIQSAVANQQSAWNEAVARQAQATETAAAHHRETMAEANEAHRATVKSIVDSSDMNKNEDRAMLREMLAGLRENTVVLTELVAKVEGRRD